PPALLFCFRKHRTVTQITAGSIRGLLFPFIEHRLFSSLKFLLKGSCLFHRLTKCSSPFVRCVGRVAATTASHFQAEGDSGRKDFDNFRVCDDPRFALATILFPIFGHSFLLSFHIREAASLCHSKPPVCPFAVWKESSGGVAERKASLFN